MFKLYRADIKDEESWKSALQSIDEGLKVFEAELGKRESAFFGGICLLHLY
jgi:hypothetical protein